MSVLQLALILILAACVLRAASALLLRPRRCPECGTRMADVWDYQKYECPRCFYTERW